MGIAKQDMIEKWEREQDAPFTCEGCGMEGTQEEDHHSGQLCNFCHAMQQHDSHTSRPRPSEKGSSMTLEEAETLLTQEAHRQECLAKAHFIVRKAAVDAALGADFSMQVGTQDHKEAVFYGLDVIYADDGYWMRPADVKTMQKQRDINEHLYTPEKT